MERKNDPTRNTERRVIDTLLKLKNASSRQIAAELGLHRKTIEGHLRKLRAANRIYIADWKKTKTVGDLRIIWALGNEPDMPKPKPKSGPQRSLERYYRNKAKESLSWLKP